MKHARTDYDGRIQDSDGLIGDDEPVLLIRGQDAAALAAGDAWIKESERIGADPATVAAVHRHLDVIARWQEEHGCKPADAPADTIRG